MASIREVWVAVETILALAEITRAIGGVDTAAVVTAASHRQRLPIRRTRIIPDGEVEHDRHAVGEFRAENIVPVEVLQGEAVPRLVDGHGVGARERLPHAVHLLVHADRAEAQPRRELRRLAAAEPGARPVPRGGRRRVEQRPAGGGVVLPADHLAHEQRDDALADAHHGVPRAGEEEPRPVQVQGEVADLVVGLVLAAVGADWRGHPCLAARDVDVDEVDEPPGRVGRRGRVLLLSEVEAPGRQHERYVDGGRGLVVAHDQEAAVEAAVASGAERVGDADVAALVGASGQRDRTLCRRCHRRRR